MADGGKLKQLMRRLIQQKGGKPHGYDATDDAGREAYDEVAPNPAPSEGGGSGRQMIQSLLKGVAKKGGQASAGDR